MSRHRLLVAIGVAVAGAFLLGRGSQAEPAADKTDRVFEIRTYTVNEGKLDDLNARFRDHTARLFKKHGMTNVGYWVPLDEPRSKNTLIYILAHDSREAAKKNWAAFRADPEWQKVKEESEANGKLVSNVESVYAAPTDYSPMK